MFDWAGIHNTKYKAFDCLLNWLNYYEDKDKNKAEPIDYLEMRFILGNERELYDFFDEYEIYIDIRVSLPAKKKEDKFIWPRIMYYDEKGRRVHVTCGEHDSRTIGEKVAFTECFNILESKHS